MPKKKFIYLDSNGTTLICQDAIREYEKWIKCYNVSSNNSITKSCINMINRSKKYVLDHCSAGKYKALFTSGASESNNFILRSTAEAYYKLRKIKPHIIISAVEHSSILECAKLMESANYATFTIIQPNGYGCISADSVKSAIQSNTCLISIMYANNEIGNINNIYEIGKVAHVHKIPMHSDCVQIFGKLKLNLPKNNLDAISISFHKFYGPKGIGLLIISNDFINGYRLNAQISGSQQSGLRGGTENPPAIASGIAALKYAFKGRIKKNKKLLNLRNYIIESIRKNKLIELQTYKDFLEAKKFVYKKSDKPSIVILGPPQKNTTHYLPNTILLSIVSHKFCNVAFKKDLDKNNIIVSIASACLTHSPNASHVLTAIKAPPIIKRGVLRISLGDTNTLKEIKLFLNIFFKLLQKHLKL